MRALKAFLLGSLAFAVVGYAARGRTRRGSSGGGRTVDVAVGPLVVVSVALEGAARVTTFGPGILVVALAGGIANVAAAQLIRRRAGRRADRVD